MGDNRAPDSHVRPAGIVNNWTSRDAFARGEPCPSCGRPVLPDLPSVCLFDVDVLNGNRDDPRRVEALRARGLIKVSRPTVLGRRTLKRHEDDEEWLEQHRAAPGHPPSASWGFSDDSGNTGPVHCMGCCSPLPKSNFAGLRPSSGTVAEV